MRYKSWFAAFFLLITILFFDTRPASACSCIKKGTVLDAFDQADIVVVTRVISRERRKKSSDPDDIVSTTMVIERIFKGNLKVDDQMFFAQGEGNDCVRGFGADDIGREFLFYLRSARTGDKLWYASICGRSNRLELATDDMLYLDNINNARGKTRISGTLAFKKQTDLEIGHRKIHITGATTTYDVETDLHGVYEIYDVPAGKYLIEAEVPDGWKVDYFAVRFSPSFAEVKEEGSKKKIQILLEDKKHAGLDIDFEIDNAIRGAVYAPNGKPINGVCVTAMAQTSDKHNNSKYTDERGNFELAELPKGGYVLLINDCREISSPQPFRRFYYPNVRERENASIFTIREGQIIDSVNISVPVIEETITVNGVFLYADGKPVADEYVEFKSKAIKTNIRGDARAKTDSEGRFSISILKGTKGKLYGMMYSYIGKYENCPKLDRIINRQGGNDLPEIKTQAIEIEARINIENVVLKYSFPKCNKAKDPN